MLAISSLLTDYFCKSKGIDENTQYKIETTDAQTLIVPERIDLMLKLKYIEFREKSYNMDFIKSMYAKHIEAFSSGMNGEPGNKEKDSIEQYFKIFDSLIDNIKKGGFNKDISVIPVGKDNIILDGAHRTAIAAYFNIPIPIIRFNGLTANYDTAFFRKQLLDIECLDYMVSEYCKLKKNIYIACLWPISNINVSREEVLSLIKNHCKIIYEKQINFSFSGLKNFITQAYSHQKWIGNFSNRFSGADSKAKECYDKANPLTVFALECNDFTKIIELKESIRNIFKQGNHSIHITDNFYESIQLANVLFNTNSIDLLNNGMPDYYVGFNLKLQAFKAKLHENGFSFDDFIIDSSSVLGLYGLRDVGDIDFLTISKGYEIIEDSTNTNHHKYISYYSKTIDALLLNPNNYLVYNELKFVTLRTLRTMKKNRNENKDIADVKLIDGYLKNKYSISLYTMKKLSVLRRITRNFTYKIRLLLILVLKKLALYNFTRKIYRILKGTSNQ